ncbi:unnamed protein product, partial [Ectocarpus sp. 8 AP-2014]
ERGVCRLCARCKTRMVCVSRICALFPSLGRRLAPFRPLETVSKSTNNVPFDPPGRMMIDRTFFRGTVRDEWPFRNPNGMYACSRIVLYSNTQHHLTVDEIKTSVSCHAAPLVQCMPT